jgi:methionyl-tRNA formyltransferase
MIVEALANLPRGELPATPAGRGSDLRRQDRQAPKPHVDWSRPAAQLERAVRAFNPFPGATVHLRTSHRSGRRAGFGRGRAGQGAGGWNDGIVVAAARAALRLTELQKPGGKRLSAADFLRGFACLPASASPR